MVQCAAVRSATDRYFSLLLLQLPRVLHSSLTDIELLNQITILSPTAVLIHILTSHYYLLLTLISHCYFVPSLSRSSHIFRFQDSVLLIYEFLALYKNCSSDDALFSFCYFVSQFFITQC